MDQFQSAFGVLISASACWLDRFSRSLRLGRFSNWILNGVLPGERHRLSKRVFIDRIEAHGCASLSSPGATRGHERCGIRAHEFLLLVWCEFDHARLPVGIQCREDPPVGSEVRMAHVCALAGAIQTECDAAEFVRAHGVWIVVFATDKSNWLQRANTRRIRDHLENSVGELAS